MVTPYLYQKFEISEGAIANKIKGIKILHGKFRSINDEKTKDITMPAPIEKTPKNGGIPIKLFLTEDMMPDGETISELENLSVTPGLQHHVAVLPDIHRKSRNWSPTGTVVAAKNSIAPRAIDTGICCGMRMVRTDIDLKDLSIPILDQLFGELIRIMPADMHEDNVLSKDDVADILVQGGKWSQKRFGLSDEELDCIEDRGTMPTDTDDVEAILDTVPAKSIRKGRKAYGILGDGNHFLELQEIVEVLNPEAAELMGLRKGQAFFMLHTGSGRVGSKMMKAYLEEYEQKFLQPAFGGSQMPIWSISADSEDGKKYARALSATSNFGFANRIAITERLRSAVRKVLHDDTLNLPLLFDCAHVSIKPETWKGEKLWIHRHGASRALPPSQFSNHPVFSKTGQPVPIPGSMGNDSFVGVTDEKAVDTFYSVNHGAGRVMDKPEAGSQFSEQQVESEMRNKDIRLYRYGSDNIAEQAPGSFKDITQVIEAMSALSLAKPVVRLRPVAVLKG